MSTFGSPPGSGNRPASIAPNDCNVPQAGNDGISSLTWSPTANFLVSSNWDSGVRCWEVAEQGGMIQANPKAQVNHENNSPVLATAFSADGSTVFSGGCDKAVRMWQLGQSPPNNISQQIGVHDAPVSCVAVLPSNIVVSGSWDRTLRFWDCRQSSPGSSYLCILHQLVELGPLMGIVCRLGIRLTFASSIMKSDTVGKLDMPERVYDLDVRGNLMVVATAGRHVIAYDVSGQPQEHSRKESPLKYQSRCISCFTDTTGFAVGSIEGRVGIHYLQKVAGKDSFAFKCHRQESQVYSVNAICFHNQFGTFATVGSDGIVNFWDKGT